MSDPGQNGSAAAPHPHRRARFGPFTLAELQAILHGLSGCMPEQHYASGRSAYAKVEKLIEEARHA